VEEIYDGTSRTDEDDAAAPARKGFAWSLPTPDRAPSDDGLRNRSPASIWIASATR
jgi:hypothetical protein